MAKTGGFAVIKHFVGAVLRYWRTLVCGVILVLLSLYAQLIGWRIPLWLIVGLFSLFAIYACYLAFADQYRRAEFAEDEMNDPKVAIVFDERVPFVEEIVEDNREPWRVLRVRIDQKAGYGVGPLEVTLDQHPFENNPLRVMHKQHGQFSLMDGRREYVNVAKQSLSSYIVELCLSKTASGRLRENIITNDLPLTFNLVVSGITHRPSVREKFRLFRDEHGRIQLQHLPRNDLKISS